MSSSGVADLRLRVVGIARDGKKELSFRRSNLDDAASCGIAGTRNPTMLTRSRVVSVSLHTKLRHRMLSTDAPVGTLRRSWLYGQQTLSGCSLQSELSCLVPSSNPQMLKKSTAIASDMIIYDLEDSVSPDQKRIALNQLLDFFVVSMNHLDDNHGWPGLTYPSR